MTEWQDTVNKWLKVPRGWTILVEAGRPAPEDDVFDLARTQGPRVLRASSQILPDDYHLTVQPPNKEWAIWLGFQKVGGAQCLVRAEARYVDLAVVLDLLRKRQPIDWWIKHGAMKIAIHSLAYAPPAGTGAVTGEADEWQGIATRVATQERDATRVATALPVLGRRNQVTPSHLAEVAEVYKSALDGKAPTRAVATHWNTTHSTAARWVQRARDPKYGFLPPTRQGLAAADSES